MLRFDEEVLAPFGLPNVSSSTPFSSASRLKQLWGFTGWFLWDTKPDAPANVAFFSGHLQLELPSRELCGITCDPFGFALIVGDWPEGGLLRFWKVYFLRWDGATREPLRYELAPDGENYAGAYRTTHSETGDERVGLARMDLHQELESDLVLHWMLPSEKYRDEMEQRIADYIRTLENQKATAIVE